MYKLPLFSLLCSSENCKSPREHSMDTVEHHRLRQMVTHHGRKVIDHWLSSRPQTFGRSALYEVDRPSLSAETCFDSSKGQNMAWQCISSNVCTNHTPYQIHDSKEHGTWFSDYQSRISMRDGPRNQVVHFDFKCNANQTNKWGLTSIILNSRGKACMSNTT